MLDVLNVFFPIHVTCNSAHFVVGEDQKLPV